MPRVNIPVEVPPGHRYCLGCKAVLPRKSFKFDARRNCYPARCEPCIREQKAAYQASRRSVALFARDRAAWNLKHTTAE